MKTKIKASLFLIICSCLICMQFTSRNYDTTIVGETNFLEIQNQPALPLASTDKGDCSDLRSSDYKVTAESWSSIDNNKQAFVFSAYRDKPGEAVKVIGASLKTVPSVFCQYWHGSYEHMQVKVHKANVLLLPENHGNRYSGAIFHCPVVDYSKYISLVTRECDKPTQILIIQNATQPKSYKRKFTVCLKPLHFQYGRAYEMVEWIELNKILGAEKFIVYNYSIAENVGAVLNHYVKQGIVEVVQWNLPITSYTFPKTKPVDIHSIGMLPMLQDCLYRNKQYSEFVVNVDVDEFIIPRSKNISNWPEMMTQIKVIADTYLFRNTFFRKEWTNANITFAGDNIAKKFNIVSLQKFQREQNILKGGSRSKYFTRTTKTNYLMIHSVQGSKPYIVPIDVGLLHHYRNWQSYKDNQAQLTDDTVLRKYGNRLLKEIENVWSKLPDIKLDIPLQKNSNHTA